MSFDRSTFFGWVQNELNNNKDYKEFRQNNDVARRDAQGKLFNALEGKNNNDLYSAINDVANQNINESADERELHLYANNHRDLHRQRMEPIRKNLVNKMASGTYDHDKAHKAWHYAAKDASDKYHKEHGHRFDKKTISNVAKKMRDEFHGQAKGGEHDHLLHKKHRKKQNEAVDPATGQPLRGGKGADHWKKVNRVEKERPKGSQHSSKDVKKEDTDYPFELEEYKVGDSVHLAFGAKGGAGVRGKVVKVEDGKHGKIHVSNGKDTWKGHRKLVTKEDVEFDVELDETELDELNKKTVIGYSNKAASQLSRDLKTATGKHTPSTNRRAKGLKKANRRIADYAKAAQRTEDVEDLDELSKDTLKSYAKKAEADIDRTDPRQWSDKQAKRLHAWVKANDKAKGKKTLPRSYVYGEGVEVDEGIIGNAIDRVKRGVKTGLKVAATGAALGAAGHLATNPAARKAVGSAIKKVGSAVSKKYASVDKHLTPERKEKIKSGLKAAGREVLSHAKERVKQKIDTKLGTHGPVSSTSANKDTEKKPAVKPGQLRLAQ